MDWLKALLALANMYGRYRTERERGKSEERIATRQAEAQENVAGTTAGGRVAEANITGYWMAKGDAAQANADMYGARMNYAIALVQAAKDKDIAGMQAANDKLSIETQASTADRRMLVDFALAQLGYEEGSKERADLLAFIDSQGQKGFERWQEGWRMQERSPALWAAMGEKMPASMQGLTPEQRANARMQAIMQSRPYGQDPRQAQALQALQQAYASRDPWVRQQANNIDMRYHPGGGATMNPADYDAMIQELNALSNVSGGPSRIPQTQAAAGPQGGLPPSTQTMLQAFPLAEALPQIQQPEIALQARREFTPIAGQMEIPRGQPFAGLPSPVNTSMGPETALGVQGMPGASQDLASLLGLYAPSGKPQSYDEVLRQQRKAEAKRIRSYIGLGD